MREKVQERDQKLSKIYRVKDGIIITKETPNRVVIPDAIAMELKHTKCAHLFNKESYNSFVNTWRGIISKYHDLEDSEDEDEEG